MFTEYSVSGTVLDDWEASEQKGLSEAYIPRIIFFCCQCVTPGTE